MDYLLDQTFRVFKSNRSPRIEASDEAYIKDNVVRYLTINNKVSSELTSKDVARLLTIQQTVNTTDNHTLNIIKIAAPDVISTQLIISVARNNEGSERLNSLVLIKSSFVKILVQLLETLPSCNDATVIHKHTLEPEYIRQTINAIADNLHSFVGEATLDRPVMNKLVAECFGNIELNYVVRSSHLNSIAINVPKADVHKLLDASEEPLVKCLDDFMIKHTQIKFNKLELGQFFSNLIFLSTNGHIKLFKPHIDNFAHTLNTTSVEENSLQAPTDYKQNFIFFVIESLHADTR